ncbi:MAG: cupin domain-containing protein [Rhodospirillaceae bacterium]
MIAPLRLNADLSERAVVYAGEMDWQPSPSPTVWRKRFFLDGPTEAGRVTSIVRYDPGSAFPPHGHPDGEEILVLDGAFCDEHGEYPAGTYLLNPDGTSHAPAAPDGCTLFVKLRQYAGAGRMRVRMNTRVLQWQPRGAPGVWHKPLHRQGGQRDWTALVKFEPGAETPPHTHPGGEETYVVDGSVEDDDGVYPAGTWFRCPAGSAHTLRSAGGAVVYLRFGGLGA